MRRDGEVSAESEAGKLRPSLMRVWFPSLLFSGRKRTKLMFEESFKEGNGKLQFMVVTSRK